MNYAVLHLKCYIGSVHVDIMLKQNKITILTVSSEKSNMVYFVSLIMKNIVSPFAWSRFPVKLICCIAYGLAWSAFCL